MKAAKNIAHEKLEALENLINELDLEFVEAEGVESDNMKFTSILYI